MNIVYFNSILYHFCNEISKYFQKVPLHIACEKGNFKIVQLLLFRHDIDVNIKSILKHIFLYNYIQFVNKILSRKLK